MTTNYNELKQRVFFTLKLFSVSNIMYFVYVRACAFI